MHPDPDHREKHDLQVRIEGLEYQRRWRHDQRDRLGDELITIESELLRARTQLNRLTPPGVVDA